MGKFRRADSRLSNVVFLQLAGPVVLCDPNLSTWAERKLTIAPLWMQSGEYPNAANVDAVSHPKVCGTHRARNFVSFGDLNTS